MNSENNSEEREGEKVEKELILYYFKKNPDLLELLKKTPEEIVEAIRGYTDKKQREDFFIAVSLNFNLNEKYETSSQIAQLMQKEYPDGKFEKMNILFTGEIKKKIGENTEAGKKPEFLEAIGREYETRIILARKEKTRREQERKKVFDPSVSANIPQKEMAIKPPELSQTREKVAEEMNSGPDLGTMGVERRMGEKPKPGLSKVANIISGIDYNPLAGEYDPTGKNPWDENEGKMFDEKGQPPLAAKANMERYIIKEELKGMPPELPPQDQDFDE